MDTRAVRHSTPAAESKLRPQAPCRSPHPRKPGLDAPSRQFTRMNCIARYATELPLTPANPTSIRSPALLCPRGWWSLRRSRHARCSIGISNSRGGVRAGYSLPTVDGSGPRADEALLPGRTGHRQEALETPPPAGRGGRSPWFGRPRAPDSHPRQLLPLAVRGSRRVRRRSASGIERDRRALGPQRDDAGVLPCVALRTEQRGGQVVVAFF